MSMEQKSSLPDSFNETLLNIAEGQSPDTNVEVKAGDCRTLLKRLPDNSVHFVLTDPPYFLDGLDDNWNDKRIKGSRAKAGVIGGLPVGMRFDPKQGRDFQAFMEPVATELLRVLVPGGFFVCFSQPRLFHRLAVACEDAGFEIRDLLAWHYTRKAQFKAFSQAHFVKRMDIPERKKQQIVRALHDRKTPQLRPQFEAMMLAQKPKEGTFVENWLRWHTGLIDAGQSLTGRVPETIMTVEKEDRADYNRHLTTKPLKLCEHLIRLFSKEGQVVLDPFMGSGTTCIAARRAGRKSIGIELNPEYVAVARRRLDGQ